MGKALLVKADCIAVALGLRSISCLAEEQKCLF